MKSKVIPFEAGPMKYDVFNIFVGRIDDQNQIFELNRGDII